MKRFRTIIAAACAALLFAVAPIAPTASAQDAGDQTNLKYGSVVKTRPPGSKRIRIRGRTFLRTDDSFFVRVKDGYRTVAPPIGTTIGNLPEDAEEVTFNDGRTYYYSGGHFFVFNEKADRYISISAGKKALRKMNKRRRTATRRMPRRSMRWLGYGLFQRTSGILFW